MKKLFKSLIALTLIHLCGLSALPLHAQPGIHGQVLLQNSRIKTGTLQPIRGANLSADSGGTAISDQDGNYRMAFGRARNMTHARIQAHKYGLVVVNARDLQAAVIGAATPLLVFMADSAGLAREQAVLYDINLKVLTAEKDRLILQLRGDTATSRAALAALKERFNREFEHRWAAEDYLNAQLEWMKERLPERIEELARVNLDFASERYRRAYGLFREGKMDLVLGLLDSLDLEAADVTSRVDSISVDVIRYAQAGEAVELGARQVMDCYRLKAEAYNLRFEYRKAAAVLEKGLELLLLVKRGVEDLEVACVYGELGSVYQDGGYFSRALAN